MRKLVPLALLLSLSCNKRVFFHPEDGAIEANKKEITIDVPAESDILIVIDNSGSMAEEIERTRRDIISFVETLSGLGNKFRIAVTTTDVADNDPTSPACGLALMQTPDADALNNGRCGKFLKPKTRSEKFLDSQAFASPKALADRFGEYVKIDSTISTKGSAVEQPMKAAWMALDPRSTMEGGPNAGFFRPDALTVFIFLTDEADCSFPIDNDGSAFNGGSVVGLNCYDQEPTLTRPEEWAAQVVQRRGDKRRVAVGLISAALRNTDGTLVSGACKVDAMGAATNSCECFLANPSQYCKYTPGGDKSFAGNCGMGMANNTCCTALGNSRLETFAKQFKTERDTICQNSFAQTLVNIAILADQQCFSLEKIPLDNNPDNIQIEIRRKDETAFNLVPHVEEGSADGWTYNGEGIPLVCLQGNFKRKVGDTIRLFSINESEGAFAASGR